LKVPTVSADLVDGDSEFQRIGAATQNDLSAKDVVSDDVPYVSRLLFSVCHSGPPGSDAFSRARSSNRLQKVYHVSQKTAPFYFCNNFDRKPQFYFCNNFDKLRSILIIFGKHILK